MIIVVGLPGVGKTTIIQEASTKGWEIINYGSLMFELAKNEFGISSRDEIRKLDEKKQEKLQKKVGDYLAKRKEKNLILDTHCSIHTNNGYLPGLPFNLLKKLQVEKLILITAPIDDILKRRQIDQGRERDFQSKESIIEHEQLNMAYLAAYSVISGAPVSIIKNLDNKLEDSKKRFLELLE
ncbi:MAG: adenylate kinase [Candidatus Anstonellaceae archaeon]